MIKLRPVNARLLNLTGYRATGVYFGDGQVTIPFGPVAPGPSPFCLRLNGVLRFIDRGLIGSALTTGLVWDIAGPFGRKHALPVPRKTYRRLIELILDYQGPRDLERRFQAVAHSALVYEGPFVDLVGSLPAT